MIVIIGAGPAGCHAASRLADSHEEIMIFEEHKEAGTPVQCTGITTQELLNYLPGSTKKIIINKPRKARINSPLKKGNQLSLSLAKPDLVIDRAKLDQAFCRQAEDKGVKIYYNHRFLNRKNNSVVIRNLKTKELMSFKPDIIIGADGPASRTAKTAGLYNHRKFFTGLQTVIKKDNDNTIDFYPLKNGFAWAVPENNKTLRIGVASTTNPRKEHQKLAKKYPGKTVSRQAGLIPLFNPWQGFSKDNVYLTGDAAGLVKATTGGGLVPGLKSAEILSHSLNNNLSYRAGIYLHLYPELWLNLRMRKAMNAFSAKDWDDLIREMNTSSSKQALENTDRDQLFRLLIKTAAANPRILRYGLKHVAKLL